MIRSKLEINGRPIDKGHPTYIIAEIGSNHNGKLEIAKQIIDLMVEAGEIFWSLTIDYR